MRLKALRYAITNQKNEMENKFEKNLNVLIKEVFGP